MPQMIRHRLPSVAPPQWEHLQQSSHAPPEWEPLPKLCLREQVFAPALQCGLMPQLPLLKLRGPLEIEIQLQLLVTLLALLALSLDPFFVEETRSDTTCYPVDEPRGGVNGSF
ncbi:hypothetical protein Taro_007673 [Colocasia esculenta]|uniref:Uncharacterized protein n=1 Tax=Colocasia esculenta TaxID=4460 RepID=A0A843TUV0_COLES|nr:hypothetical protein [Colocasia esculenta]